MRNPPPDLFVKRLAGLVNEAREQGQTIEAIADAVGVHRSRLYRWLDGDGSPEGTKLAALADHFEVGMDWLWGRPGWPKRRSAGDGPAPAVSRARARAEAVKVPSAQPSKRTPRRRDRQGP